MCNGVKRRHAVSCGLRIGLLERFENDSRAALTCGTPTSHQASPGVQVKASETMVRTVVRSVLFAQSTRGTEIGEALDLARERAHGFGVLGKVDRRTAP